MKEVIMACFDMSMLQKIKHYFMTNARSLHIRTFDLFHRYVDIFIPSMYDDDDDVSKMEYKLAV